MWVCVDLLRYFLWYSVSSPTPSNLLGPCDKQAELWSTLEAAIVATSNSLSSKCKFEWSKKHRKLGSFFLPNSSPALYLFHRPSVPVSLLKEHTASLSAVVPLCCCSLLYPRLPPPASLMVFVYIPVCTKLTMKKTCTASCHFSFHFCLAYSL